MPDPRDTFLKLAEQTLNFECLCAGDSALPRGHTTGWRTLPGTVVSHITGTSMFLETDDAKFEIRKGAYCIVPGVHHVSYGEGGRCRWIHANFTVFGGLNLFTFLSMPHVLSARASQGAATIVEKIAAIPQNADSMQTCITRKSLGLRLLEALLADASTSSHQIATAGSAQRLIPALMYVRDNLARPIEIAQLARLVHLSPSRFSAVFRSVLGVSPGGYLQRERLQKAQELLIQSDLSIAAIGASVGWDNPYFFSRFFHQKLGQTPTQYRRTVRQGLLT
ncbi:MAG TPA: AraC family transcriptional regulator [Planctomycetota bacterium]|nr:AraC family transcriptional regulator [Planctomycetota bacterium]